METIKRVLRRFIYGSLPIVAGSFPYYGARVYFPEGSHIFHLACEQGVYEHESVVRLLSLVRSNTYFFDIGANIGLLSLPVLYGCHGCKVMSFEPSPNTLPYLLRTARESRYKDRWTIVGKAVGEKTGETCFCIASPQEGAFDGIHSTRRVASDREIVVPMTTIDAEWELLGKPSVSAFKIDVEGAELLVLRGGRDCIKAERPHIITEWNAANLKAYHCLPEELLRYAEEIHYRVFSMPSLVPVTDIVNLKTQMIRTETFLLISEEI